MRRTLLGEREAIARVTASVCRDLRVDLYSSGGMMPPTVYGATTERNFFWRVFLSYAFTDRYELQSYRAVWFKLNGLNNGLNCHKQTCFFG